MKLLSVLHLFGVRRIGLGRKLKQQSDVN